MSIIHCLTIVLSFARTANLFIEESTSQRVSGTVQKKLKIVWRILPNSETVTFFEEWKLTYPSDNSHYSPFTPPPPLPQNDIIVIIFDPGNIKNGHEIE